jgi:hypothetical protein
MSFYGANLTQLASDIAYDPRGGKAGVLKWRGTPTGIAAQVQLVEALKLRYDTRELEPGGYVELLVYVGGGELSPPDEVLADTWTLDCNEIEQSIWLLDKVIDMFNTGGWTTQDKVDLRADIENLFSGGTSLRTGQPATVEDILSMPGLSAGEITILDGLIGALMQNIEVKPFDQPVIRRRLVLPKGSSARPFQTGVGKLITTANLRAGADPSGTPPDVFDLETGWWRKKRATVDFEKSASTFEIVQEWWWHAKEYDAFTWEVFP